MLYSSQPMHIPDGFLNLYVSVVCWVITAITISMAVSRTNKSLGEKQVPLMGVMAAFIFAAQMINFPVAGGTSGHLLGGLLAAMLLGPAPAVVVMTTVFAAQCLLYQDGGLTALGANTFNMGIIGSVGGYGIYWALCRLRLGERAAVAAASWLCVMLGAAAASVELGLS